VSAVAHARAGDAAIVIFPGVRYEPPRGGNAEGPRKAGDGASRKRKDKTS
jgi:hypothetical protein